MIPTFVFDKTYHTVPDRFDASDPSYYHKIQYLPNVATGTQNCGIAGHGSMFVDMFYSDTPYNTIKTCDITDETDLFYLMEPWPLFNGLVEEYGDEIKMPLNWHFVLKHIPQEILQLARDCRITLILHIPEYTSGCHAVDYRINSTRLSMGIPETQLKFISGNRTPEWYYWPGFEYSQFLCYNRIPKVTEVNLKQRSKKYTCLNRIDKMHRRYIAITLWRQKLNDDGYYSYSFGEFTHKGLTKASHNTPVPYMDGNWNISPDEWKEYYNSGPYMADTLTLNAHNDHWHVEKPHFNDAYWNFVTETSISDETCLTEKTFKPIANLQPFVVFGSYGTLETLKDMGYKTFHGFIDETYDTIKDHELRIILATAQAVALAHMSHQDHIKLMHQIKPILEYNQQHFFRSKHRMSTFVKYIKGMDPSYNWLKDCKYD
jgi:hypothetical protein